MKVGSNFWHADMLYQHYATSSTDPDYVKLLLKQTGKQEDMDYISQWEVFKILDYLQVTTTELDLLPAWFI